MKVISLLTVPILLKMTKRRPSVIQCSLSPPSSLLGGGGRYRPITDINCSSLIHIFEHAVRYIEQLISLQDLNDSILINDVGVT